MVNNGIQRWLVVNTILTYIDYYIGSDGKTIIITTHSRDWIISLRSSIMRLFNDEMGMFDICKLANTRCSNAINEFKLIKVVNNVKPCISANRMKTCFSWKQNKEEIETLLGLIDGLILDDSPGHQYLDPADEAVGYTIELSYNERLPEWLHL